MRYAAIAIALIALFALASAPGCGGKSESDVTTLEQAREEAAKEITPQNAGAELEKITREIDADNE